VKVERVKVAKALPDRTGGDLLAFEGINVVSPDFPDVRNTVTSYADEWVVVER
jgi:hypothetical protein